MRSVYTMNIINFVVFSEGRTKLGLLNSTLYVCHMYMTLFYLPHVCWYYHTMKHSLDCNKIFMFTFGFWTFCDIPLDVLFKFKQNMVSVTIWRVLYPQDCFACTIYFTVQTDPFQVYFSDSVKGSVISWKTGKNTNFSFLFFP